LFLGRRPKPDQVEVLLVELFCNLTILALPSPLSGAAVCDVVFVLVLVGNEAGAFL
jgi:hypothetical protein